MSLEILHTLSKLTPNSLQTHMFFCYFIFWGEKRNEFGVSLEILQTHSKPAPNSYVFIFSAFTYYIFVATPLGPEITYSGRCFIGTSQINLVHAYHPERLSSCKLSGGGIFPNNFLRSSCFNIELSLPPRCLSISCIHFALYVDFPHWPLHR